jgi:hypothetical protein
MLAGVLWHRSGESQFLTILAIWCKGGPVWTLAFGWVFCRLKNLEFVFWLDNALAWSELMFMSCLVLPMLVNILCLRTEGSLFLFFGLEWHHWKKNHSAWWRMLFDVKWARSIQEFLKCPLHVTCEKLVFLPRKEHPRSFPLPQLLHTNHKVAL